MQNSPTSKTLQPDSNNRKSLLQSAAMGLNNAALFVFIGSSVCISARPVSNNTGNNGNISISCNEGKTGAENEYVRGRTGEKVSLGDISGIHVSGTNRGCIGGRNNYTVTGGIAAKSNIGNIHNVTVGTNSGSIGSGNRINIRS